MTDIENNARGGSPKSYPGGYFRKLEDSSVELSPVARDLRDLAIGTVETIDRIGANLVATFKLTDIIPDARRQQIMAALNSTVKPAPILSNRKRIQGGHFVVKQGDEHFLSITDNEYGCDNDFLPISKALHDLIAEELGDEKPAA